MNEGTQPPPSRPARRPTYADHAALSAKVGRFLSGKFHATGLTREEAASRAGCTPGYLTGILAGRVVAPSPDIVRAMAENWGFNILDYFKVAGLINDRDVALYMSKQKTITETATGEPELIYSRLASLPPQKRGAVSKILIQLLDAIGAEEREAHGAAR